VNQRQGSEPGACHSARFLAPSADCDVLATALVEPCRSEKHEADRPHDDELQRRPEAERHEHVQPAGRPALDHGAAPISDREVGNGEGAGECSVDGLTRSQRHRELHLGRVS